MYTSKGINPMCVWEMSKYLASNQFTDIVSDFVACPLGWNGRPGQLQLENARQMYLSLGRELRPILNMSKQEYVSMLGPMMEDFKESRTWMKYPYVYGRKPLS